MLVELVENYEFRRTIVTIKNVKILFGEVLISPLRNVKQRNKQSD